MAKARPPASASTDTAPRTKEGITSSLVAGQVCVLSPTSENSGQPQRLLWGRWLCHWSSGTGSGQWHPEPLTPPRNLLQAGDLTRKVSVWKCVCPSCQQCDYRPLNNVRPPFLS